MLCFCCPRQLVDARETRFASLLERPLMDVWFRDANTGFAFGAYGIYLRTDDGGESWEDLSFDIDNPDGFHYNAVTPVKGAGLLLAGRAAGLCHSG